MSGNLVRQTKINCTAGGRNYQYRQWDVGKEYRVVKITHPSCEREGSHLSIVVVVQVATKKKDREETGKEHPSLVAGDVFAGDGNAPSDETDEACEI